MLAGAGAQIDMDRATLAMAMTAMADPKAKPSEVARRLGLTTTTLYSYVNGDRSPKAAGAAVLTGTSTRGKPTATL